MSNSVYQGHLADGSSVQKHSAGRLYPCVLYVQVRDDKNTYGVITPQDQDGQLIGTFDQAVEYALAALK
jgi:hypothetical protein